MVHARLGIAAENSGKLVSRSAPRRGSSHDERRAILIDGPPGIGCPVIAAITGATGVLVVTEPTVSGVHDMERVLELANHFGIPAAVCVNRWDINPEGAARIEDLARNRCGSCRPDPLRPRGDPGSGRGSGGGRAGWPRPMTFERCGTRARVVGERGRGQR